jgi:DNA-binding MarR family transcriptional regulator
MDFTIMSSLEPKDLLIGALLRVPAQAIHRRLIAGLNAAGFNDLRLPHIAVFQYPGPDGCRPGDLAERAGISKQAMNQLLQSLEQLGYIRRGDAEEDGRARIVRLTKRGKAVWDQIYQILVTIEIEWRATLGERQFEQLKKLLCKVWTSGLVD